MKKFLCGLLILMQMPETKKAFPQSIIDLREGSCNVTFRKACHTLRKATLFNYLFQVHSPAAKLNRQADIQPLRFKLCGIGSHTSG